MYRTFSQIVRLWPGIGLGHFLSLLWKRDGIAFWSYGSVRHAAIEALAGPSMRFCVVTRIRLCTAERPR